MASSPITMADAQVNPVANIGSRLRSGKTLVPTAADLPLTPFGYAMDHEVPTLDRE